MPEPKQYTGWEIAKLSVVALSGLVTGPTSGLDRRIDRVQEKAIERERIAEAAKAKVRAEKEKAEFDAKVEKAARKYRR